MRYISLFSGIEAATVAWHDLGWEPVAFCEIDEFPSAVLAHRFPNVPNLGDITKVDWSEYVGSVDLIVGGSPCQSFSISGKREGLKGESGLMFEYIRAVREIRPRWFIWENVPGALSSEKGDAFRQLLSEMDECGYGLAWRVLDAQFFGVAQRRRRVFLVGSLGDQRAAEILFDPDSLRWDHPSSREKRQDLTRAAQQRAAEGRCKCVTQYGDEIAGALTARGDSSPCADRGQNIVCIADDNANAAVDFDMCGSLKVGGSVPIVSNEYTVRKLTPTEHERLQGFPDDHTLIPYKGKPAEECPDTPRYKALGNSMAVPVMRWIGERIAMVEGRE